MKEKFKLTPLERSWILYDIANSAFVLLAATLIPIFFNAERDRSTPATRVARPLSRRAAQTPAV